MSEPKELATSLVVVFCGPHDNDGKVSFRRIDAGIAGALLRPEKPIPLIICGDGNGGYDCRQFERRALERGVPQVHAVFDPRASTYSDADSVCHAIRYMQGYSRITRLFLVTDWWHMERAGLFLGRMLDVLVLERKFEVLQAPVPCPAPPQEQILAEKRGIRDFLADRYDLAHRGTPYGKPFPGNRDESPILV